MKNELIIMETSEIIARMKLAWWENLLVLSFHRARLNASREIQKFDFYSQILRDLKNEVDESDTQMRVLADFVEELPVVGVEKVPIKVVKLTLQQYKQKNATMEQIIPEWKALLEQNQEWYGKYNLYRIMHSLSWLFANGHTAVGLLYTKSKHDWDLKKISEEIKKDPSKAYYMLSGNNVDMDEFSAFNVMWNKQLSGIVIRNDCPAKRIETLVSEYFKNCDLYDVAIIAID